MSLKEYKRKRDFKKTAEPEGSVEKSAGELRFVIQKHDASHLHYDFRLEQDGTLKSWAVPKGVPYAKGEKRLAIQVEDHPISYIEFEGTIPEGEYGGGTVMVWDYGTYKPLSENPAKELASGKLHVLLSGKKLSGEWYLVRLKDGKQWLLVKADEPAKPVSAKQDDTSAKSGKSMKQLSASGQEWSSGSSRKVSSKESTVATPVSKKVKVGISKKKVAKGAHVSFVEPMKARLSESELPGDWIYEVKFDGFRALALKSGKNVQLLSRNNKDLGSKFPDVVEAVANLNCNDAILDGEIVALDKKGRSSFQMLQSYGLNEGSPPLLFYAFDLLQLDGEDLKRLPLEERKAKLETLIGSDDETIKFSSSLDGKLPALLKQAAKLQLEGLIGKQKGSLYESGKRTGTWIKLKLRAEQEVVIGGFSPPGGSREHFGALLVGYYEKGELKYAGKVGTGFDAKLLQSLSAQFKKISQEACPFVGLPEKRKPRYGLGMTASEMKRCHWVKPILVCQIKFAEWTSEGKLRQPSFLGLREDKDAREVVREKAKS